MLAIVRIALSRPYTFVVAALLIFLVGTLSALRMPVDIFPSINIPIIGVAFQYQGLPPDQMAGRIITPFERALTTTVNDIEHFEANSYTTFGIVKIYFHPTANIATANAQVTAIAQTLLKQLPPGETPPLILNYSASRIWASISCARVSSRFRAPGFHSPSAAGPRRSCTISIPARCSRSA